MNQEQTKRLGARLHEARTAKGLSLRELAKRTGLNDATIGRVEQGVFESPSPRILAALADELNVPLSDLYALAEYAVPKELPTFTPYLRAKYGDLPSDAVEKIEQSFSRIARQYGYDSKGPAPGEDEI